MIKSKSLPWYNIFGGKILTDGTLAALVRLDK
jgi:hypothetical protein